MTPKTLNRKNSNLSKLKIFLLQIYISQNVLEIYLVNGFIKKKSCCFRQFFNQKLRASTWLWQNFLYSGWMGVICDSQATIRSAAGRRGVLTGIPSFLHVGRLRVIYGSQQHGHVLFYSHLDRVNGALGKKVKKRELLNDLSKLQTENVLPS